MKNLLVTGAAGGIGSEIATYASKKGYRVGLMDANHEKMPRIMVSYALEKISSEKKKKYMLNKKQIKN